MDALETLHISEIWQDKLIYEGGLKIQKYENC